MTIWRLTSVSITALILYGASYSGTMALAQCSREMMASNTGTLPDAPGVASPQNNANTPAPLNAKDGGSAVQVPNGGKQTKRILYIIPNFRAVSVDEKLPPQTIKDKFTTGALDSVDYLDENLWVEFLLPTVLHQDSRYYTLGRGGFAKRLGYSLSRTVITRTDSGHETFNASEIFGAGAAAGISSLYYPSQERTFSKTYQLWLTNIAIDAGSNLFKELWPDINSKIFHQKE
jgi:hypothetical protein